MGWLFLIAYQLLFPLVALGIVLGLATRGRAASLREAFSDLRQAASGVAQALQREGIGHGDRVAVLLKN